MRGLVDGGSGRGQWQTPRLLHPKQFTDGRSQLITAAEVTGRFVLPVSCYISNRCSLSLIQLATAEQKFGHLSRVAVVEIVFKGKEALWEESP